MPEFQNAFFTSTSEVIEAQYVMGVLALQRGDFDAASRHFRNSADGGHVSALYNLSLLLGGGSVTPYDFDLAADCWYKAAEAGHPNARASLWQLEAADRGGYGADNLAMFAERPNPAGSLNPHIMICAARFYDVVCQACEATADVVAYELDAAATSDFEFVHWFIKRTGIDKEFYEGGLGRLIAGSAADQITDGLNKLHGALRRSGVSDELAVMARCSIVGHIIAKSPYGERAQALLGVDKFFQEANLSNRKPPNVDPDTGANMGLWDVFRSKKVFSRNHVEGKRLFEIGMQHASKYECSKAIEFYTESIAMSPNPAPYMNRAHLLTKRLRYREALADLLEAQRLDQLQGNEFVKKLSIEIPIAEIITANYDNEIRDQLIDDLKQSNNRDVAGKIFCSSFGISYNCWKGGTFGQRRPIAEFHFFSEIDNIAKFEELSFFPEVEEFMDLYGDSFIEMKIRKCPDPIVYTKSERTLHSFMCCYDLKDMRYIRRSMLYHLHEILLWMDYEDRSLSGDCRGRIREAEEFNS